jgi:hypothetical protein
VASILFHRERRLDEFLHHESLVVRLAGAVGAGSEPIATRIVSTSG